MMSVSLRLSLPMAKYYARRGSDHKPDSRYHGEAPFPNRVWLEVAWPYEREDRDQAPGPRLLGGAKAGRRPAAPHGAHGDARDGPLAERRDGVSRRLAGGARRRRPLRALGAAGRRQLPPPLPRGARARPPPRPLRGRGHRLSGPGDPRLRGRAGQGGP